MIKIQATNYKKNLQIMHLIKHLYSEYIFKFFKTMRKTTTVQWVNNMNRFPIERVQEGTPTLVTKGTLIKAYQIHYTLPRCLNISPYNVW